VELLLTHGANVNIVENSSHATALMAAAHKGWKDVVARLLAAGADRNLKTTSGNTAIMIAKAQGHDEVARLLSSRRDGS
jgi:uncharacterized protein